MKDISIMITAIATLLSKPKSEKVGLIRVLTKTQKRAERLYWKATRKFGRKPTEKQISKLDNLWNNIMDLSDEIENINN